MHVLSGNDVVMCDVDVMHAAGGYYLETSPDTKEVLVQIKTQWIDISVSWM